MHALVHRQSSDVDEGLEGEAMEVLEVVASSLALGKNVVLARNFDQLDLLGLGRIAHSRARETGAGRKRRMTIDVWVSGR